MTETTRARQVAPRGLAEWSEARPPPLYHTSSTLAVREYNEHVIRAALNAHPDAADPNGTPQACRDIADQADTPSRDPHKH
jgi:hypothetical protein